MVIKRADRPRTHKALLAGSKGLVEVGDLEYLGAFIIQLFFSNSVNGKTEKLKQLESYKKDKEWQGNW